MTRSYRKTPIAGIAGGPMGWFKRFFNHRERARMREVIAHGDYDNAEWSLPWDEWDSPRDGKQWMGDYFTDKKTRSK